MLTKTLDLAQWTYKDDEEDRRYDVLLSYEVLPAEPELGISKEIQILAVHQVEHGWIKVEGVEAEIVSSGDWEKKICKRIWDHLDACDASREEATDACWRDYEA